MTMQSCSSNRKKQLKKRIANQIANDYLSNISLDGSVKQNDLDAINSFNIFYKLNSIKLGKNEKQTEYFKSYKEKQSIENPNRNRLKTFISNEFHNGIQLENNANNGLDPSKNVADTVILESCEIVGDLVVSK
jgi:hypothetical protein